MNKTKVASWLDAMGFVVGIIGVFMLFLPAMRVTISSTGSQVGVYNGFQTAFGYTETTVGGVKTNIIGFSFLNFLSILLIVLGLGFWLYNFLNANIIRNIIISVLLTAGGILAFFTVQFVVTSSGANWTILSKALREGPILLGALAIVSAGCSLASGILSSKANKK